MYQFFIDQANIGDFVFYCIVDNTSEKPVGLCSYNTVVPQHRSIQVGFLVYAPTFKRSTGATEAMYLMMRHAFEDLGYRRYEWKTNAQNKASRRAALRLGFTYEGTFRNHWIVKGYNRDTAWHSVIDKEWPLRKNAFETWLSPNNFDEQGVQKQSLSSLNGVKE